jgi:DNA-binding MarR family transcriptional regulator
VDNTGVAEALIWSDADDADDEDPTQDATQDALTDAVVGASRALLAVAVRSLGAGGQGLTLVQYRALVVLSYHGAQRIADLAEALAVNSSTVTRLADRLVRKGLVCRMADQQDRRTTRVSITAAGEEVVRSVIGRRRSEIAEIVAKMPGHDRGVIVAALEAFTVAAGEAPEQAWTQGWTS